MLKTLLDLGYNAYRQMKQAEQTRPAERQDEKQESPASEVALSRLDGTPLESDRHALRKLPVSELKTGLAQETAALQQSIRQKLSDLGIPAGTQIRIQKTAIGTLSVESRLPDQQREKLEQTLNADTHLRHQFERLSLHQPAVDFVANATRIHKAYGADNLALRALISRDEQQNQLPDLAERMDRLRQQLPGTEGRSAAAQRLLNEAEPGFQLAVSL